MERIRIRRRLPRQFTDWRGRCLIEGNPDAHWQDCHVIDISSAGAGLALLDAGTTEAVGDRIIIEIQLVGELRSRVPDKDNRSRLGIEFVDLSDSERRYLDSLAELQAVW